MVSNVAAGHVSRMPGTESGVRRRDSRSFATAAAIIYGFAGFAIPLLGWFAGLALVWASTRLSRRAKLVSAIVPTALMLLVVIAVAGASAAHAAAQVSGSVSAVPSGYDIAWSGLAVVVVVTSSLGLWLVHSLRQ
ncbi:hypothetical protein [Paramicrobacterium chengjingii]|uniref:Uncharacterized protein n=1 Tax=Paramicrobacterium chengjingii TaxID=2769067 RepID=A0ABX6YMI6_9MICO|nr:hypothetical protein [Microbacterium chengjingii]QPZ39895.1 hypothetical protein HCR76_07710 [Microbacterium chengjingii]